MLLDQVSKSVFKGRTGPDCNWGGEEGKSDGGGQGGEMTQTMYAHVNKWK
jgi:hypothetical protein